MKVLVATNMYPTEQHPYYGIFVKQQVESLERQGVEVDVLFTDASIRRASYVTDIGRMAEALRGGGYDVMHAHHTYSVIQSTAAMRRASVRVPLVFSFHEGEAALEAGVEDPDADFLKRFVYSKRIKRFALRRADRVLSVSPGLPEEVGFTGGYDVVPPGIDLDVFRPMDQASCRDELSIERDARVLLFPANPERTIDKGVDVLRAALELLEENVEVFYGGAIAHETMPIYMNAADVVVLTSRFEASPMVVKEAMACDRPIVSTDVGDVARVFGETPGCFLTERTRTAVAAALTDALRFSGSVGGRARIQALGLSLDETARRVVQVYESVVR